MPEIKQTSILCQFSLHFEEMFVVETYLHVLQTPRGYDRFNGIRHPLASSAGRQSEDPS